MNPVVRKTWHALFCTVLLSTSSELSAASYALSNTNLITINDSADPPTKAAPYPSSITFTGLVGQAVTKATVTLYGFTHPFPSDVDILLVGPQGQMAILMSSVGGQNKYSVTNLTLTLDDAAENSLPVYSALTSGVFKPTNGYLTLGYPSLPFDFPPPAAAGNSNSVTALSVFKDADPDGTWNLFVADDVGGDAGSISGGWNLNLTVSVPLQMTRSQSNVVISWPGSATNYSLQATSTTLGSNMWSGVTNVPTLTSGRYAVTNPILSGSKFYRLIQQ